MYIKLLNNNTFKIYTRRPITNGYFEIDKKILTKLIKNYSNEIEYIKHSKNYFKIANEMEAFGFFYDVTEKGVLK